MDLTIENPDLPMKQDERIIKHVELTRKFCDGILQYCTCAKGMKVHDDFLVGFHDHLRVRCRYPYLIGHVFETLHDPM